MATKLALLFALIFVSAALGAARPKLLVSLKASANLLVIDAATKVETTLAVEAENGLTHTTEDGVFGGLTVGNKAYIIDGGYRKNGSDVTPSINRVFDGPEPFHFESHFGWIVLHFDGEEASGAAAEEDSYVLAIEEDELLEADPHTIQFSDVEHHHGFAIAAANCHFISTVPEEETSKRSGDGVGVKGVRVFTHTDQEVKVIANLTDEDSHCSDYHGGAVIGNNHLFGCEKNQGNSASPGGFLVVTYDPVAMSFSSKRLPYPESTTAFRPLEIKPSPFGEYFVADYTLEEDDTTSNATGQGFLRIAAAVPDALPAGSFMEFPWTNADMYPCGYKWNRKTQDQLVVLAPDGTLYVFKVSDWTQLGSLRLFTNGTCGTGKFRDERENLVVGEDEAWVAENTGGAAVIYKVDLSDPANMTIIETFNVAAAEVTSMSLTGIPGPTTADPADNCAKPPTTVAPTSVAPTPEPSLAPSSSTMLQVSFALVIVILSVLF